MPQTTDGRCGLCGGLQAHGESALLLRLLDNLPLRSPYCGPLFSFKLAVPRASHELKMNDTVGGGVRPLVSSALGRWRRGGVYSIHLQDEESVCASILSRSGP